MTPPASAPRDILWLTPSRIAASLEVFQPATRIFGAMTIYLGLAQPFRIVQGGGDPVTTRFAIVAPHMSHFVRSPDGRIDKILLEPETVDVAAVREQLSGSPERLRATMRTLQTGFETLRSIGTSEIDFDFLFFGHALSPRRLDPRIARVLDKMAIDGEQWFSAREYAAVANLSLSRFTHLFRAQTGSSFRDLRAWKHARDITPLIGRRSNLTEIAFQLGYADSPHFCRSIRKFYGITPTSFVDNACGVELLRE